MATSLAPIVFFAFRRPLTTLQSLYTLSRCPEAADSTLYVFCDAAKNAQDEANVRRTREVVRAHPWCARVEVIEAAQNLGLAQSVIGGVTRVCQEHGRVIVVEDDLLLARGFLAYMNESLRRYASHERVMSISGHTFAASHSEPRACFLPAATSWGWATWSRAWSEFEYQPRGLDHLSAPGVAHRFDLDGSFDYAGLLRAQMSGGVDSWAIRWWWTIFRREGLGLFPCNSLVKNIGASLLATHTVQDSPLLAAETFDLDNQVVQWPAEVRVDSAYFETWKAALRSGRPGGPAPAGRVVQHASRARQWLRRRIARPPRT